MKTLNDLTTTHKLCTACNVYKLFSSFGKHKETKDGLRYECKDCINNINEAGRNKIKQDDVLYADYLKRKRECQQKYKYKSKRNHQTTINYRIKNPERDAVYIQVSKAVKSGELTKLPCHVCGCENSEAHHEDYSKPLDVVWLCRKHHRELHRKYSELVI